MLPLLRGLLTQTGVFYFAGIQYISWVNAHLNCVPGLFCNSYFRDVVFVKSDEPVCWLVTKVCFMNMLYEQFPFFCSAPGPGGIPPRGLLGDGPNDPRGGTLLSVTGEVIDPK